MNIKNFASSLAFAAPTLAEFKFADPEAKTRSFSGYGAVFNNIDAGGDAIMPGAFKATLAAFRKAKEAPLMLLQHGFAETTLPIGEWTKMEEDDHGLKVEGALFDDDVPIINHTYAAMKRRALKGLSIGYRPKEIKLGTKPDEPRRSIKTLDLFETSVVVWPMNPKATVDAVKADAVRSKSDFENVLRDAGFSKSLAAYLSAGWTPPARRDDGDDLSDKSAADLFEAALKA